MKHRRALITLALIATAAWLTTLPVAETVRAPAIYSIAQHQKVFAPVSGIMVDEWVKTGQMVRKGDAMARLQSPDLDHQLQQAQRGREPLRFQVERQGLDDRLKEQGRTISSRLSKAGQSVQDLTKATLAPRIFSSATHGATVSATRSTRCFRTQTSATVP